MISVNDFKEFQKDHQKEKKTLWKSLSLIKSDAEVKSAWVIRSKFTFN